MLDSPDIYKSAIASVLAKLGADFRLAHGVGFRGFVIDGRGGRARVVFGLYAKTAAVCSPSGSREPSVMGAFDVDALAAKVVKRCAESAAADKAREEAEAKAEAEEKAENEAEAELRKIAGAGKWSAVMKPDGSISVTVDVGALSLDNAKRFAAMLREFHLSL